MEPFLLVGIGGAIGSVLRYEISKIQPIYEIPVGTMLVNISGTFLLSLLTFSAVQGDIQYLIGIGGLGGYTTFSTYMYETFRMMEEQNFSSAAVYICTTLGCSLIAVFLGYMLCGRI